MDGLTDEEWLHYSYVGHTATWKVVLLSLNINPKYAEIENDHYALFRETTTKIIRLDRREYSGSVTNSQIQERYEIIENRNYVGKYFVGNFEVDIHRFVEFAEKINLRPFPEKFIKLFQKEINLSSNKEEATKPTVAENTPRLKPPKRIRDYNVPLRNTVNILFEKNKQIPSGPEVLELWRSEKPREIYEVMNKSFKYQDESGGIKEVDMANLKKAILRLFESD